MKILTLLLLILLFSKTHSGAQEIIHGKVTDESGIPVSFATVTLSTKNTDAQTTIRVTDENGLFQFKLSHASGQLFIITAIGYETLSREFPVLPEKPAGTLLFSLKKQVNNLSEVSISGRKRLITQKIDRLVMNLGNNSLTAGKSAIEVLGMAPGVFVNNGTISISGNAGTRVMINGKILPLSGDDLTNYLTGLRAEDIEAIEVITHPPAEYDAQGTGGMLNIILKKQAASGLSGSLNAGYTQGRYAGTDEGMRLNFNHKKLSFYTAYNFNKLKSYEDSRMTRLYINQPFQFRESANRVINDNGQRISGGLTYDLSGSQYLSINYTGSFNRKVSPYNSTASVDYADPQQQDLFNRGTFPTSTKTDYNNIGINYHISSDTLGSGFRLLADYTHNSLIKNSLANSSFYNENNELLSDTTFRNTTPSYASIYTADAGYTAVLSNRNSLSAGIKGTSTVINNTAQFEHIENGLWHKDPE
ncbi:MAG TPA: TonB-dependent receptor, partial [Pedobacter sp.]